ncbi:glycosyltransferase family 10 [Clostridium aestuarii]|uniref:Glycosyltransferase family 10 n=1 Tax=Clostridium aestuarii TaxID=338193 RepID=A0ABT4CUU7_9CLOT|nr:glycosyltransferase family 10 [Clostridium aestuarii]MCY6482756.1 glycosyltransferase family 10 [Clostridium aestuarii]
MQIGIINCYEIYNKKNSLFNPARYSIGENMEYPIVILKNKLNKMNSSIDTLDMYPIEKYDKIIFIDIPSCNIRYDYNLISKDLYLILMESSLIKPENYIKENHKCFKKIFTWNDELVDKKKYIKYYWPNKIPVSINFDINSKSKLCTMIAGHKLRIHPLELYSERIKAVRWFEENHIEDFDLYGIDWDKMIVGFNGNLIDNNNYPSYKGRIESKNKILKKYKFCICYENATGINGYITEKIFDCFFAGCIPIYWGVTNITDSIPKNTFIDKRDFSTYKELYDYIKNMSQNEYIKYIDAISAFIKSEQIQKFSAKGFAENIIKEIMD